MEINTTNISLDRYLQLVEIEKNFNKKFKVVYSCGYGRNIEYYSDNKTFENEIIENQNKKLDKLELENLQLKSTNEDLKHKLLIFDMYSNCDKKLIEIYKNKNLIERIFNL